MTLAVCFKCGGPKFGAFTPCLDCMHRPRTHDEFALSLLLSDHFADAETRARMSAQIRCGAGVEIQPELREQLALFMSENSAAMSMVELANQPRDPHPKAIDVAREFWRLMNTNDFASVATVLADHFALEWPQSRERIRGAERFARLNAEYPAAGPWSFTMNRIVGGEGSAVTLVTVTDGQTTAQAITFFVVHQGKITRLVEFWPEPFPASVHRAHLVEPME